MKYYKVMYNYSNSDDLMFLNIKESELPFERYEVYRGKPLPVEEIYCTVAEDQTEKCDYIANNLTWFVVSEKVKNIFEQFNICKCQYIKVIDKDTNCLIGYLVNCIERIDAFNKKNALYNQDSTDIVVFKYSIDEEKARQVDLLQLEGHLHPWFVSDRLRKELKKNKAIGFDYSLLQ